MHKKIDLSNVTSKCGSKDNIRYKPGTRGFVLSCKKNKEKRSLNCFLHKAATAATCCLHRDPLVLTSQKKCISRRQHLPAGQVLLLLILKVHFADNTSPFL